MVDAAALAWALRHGRPGSQQVLANFVGGQYVAAQDGRTSEVIDPSTGEAYLRAPVSALADVDAALRTAAAAFETWRDTTPAAAQPGAAAVRRRHRGQGRGPRRGRVAEHRQAGGDDQGRRGPPLADELQVLRRRGPHPGG